MAYRKVVKPTPAIDADVIRARNELAARYQRIKPVRQRKLYDKMAAREQFPLVRRNTDRQIDG